MSQCPEVREREIPDEKKIWLGIAIQFNEQTESESESKGKGKKIVRLLVLSSLVNSHTRLPPPNFYARFFLFYKYLMHTPKLSLFILTAHGMASMSHRTCEGEIHTALVPSFSSSP
jgi:hypothetical protein